MKKINETFYEITAGLYAEQRGPKWWITDEEERVIAGPFDTLEALAADRERWVQERADTAGPAEAAALALVATIPAAAPVATEAADLVTLREAAQFLPVTRQNLEYHRKRGSLTVDPVVVGRSVELYSLKQLKEAFPS